MTNFSTQYAWQEQFLPQVKQIIAPHMVRVSTVDEDQKRNTDMMMIRVDGCRVAVRVRQFKYVGIYGDQFTIRSKLPSGAKTEFAKIIEGWGDLVFYGFASEDETSLVSWIVGDLRVFRSWVNRSLWDASRVRPKQITNRDGSKFMAFGVDDMPDAFLLERERWQPPKHPGGFSSPAHVPNGSYGDQLELSVSKGGR